MVAMEVAFQEGTWHTLEARIERLTWVKIGLFREWRQAISRASCAPVPYCYEALLTVGHRYRDLVDAIEGHISTLEASRENPLCG